MKRQNTSSDHQQAFLLLTIRTTQIQTIDPSFISRSGIDQSLTPGRNNGFLNMIQVMKNQALTAGGHPAVPAVDEGNEEGDSGKGPIYNQMVAKLRMLQPTEIDLEDESHKHANHAGAKGFDGEVRAERSGKRNALSLPPSLSLFLLPLPTNSQSLHPPPSQSHFKLYIVAPAFDGLNSLKRHRLIYTILGDVMDRIHALEIVSKSPSEV